MKTLSLLRTLIVKVSWRHPNSVSAPTVNTQHGVRLVSWKDAMTLCIVSLFLMLQTSYEEWVMVSSWWTSSWFTLLWLDWGQLVLPPDQQIALSTSSMGKGPFRAEKQALWQTTGLIDLDVVVSFKCWLEFRSANKLHHQSLLLLVPAVWIRNAHPLLHNFPGLHSFYSSYDMTFKPLFPETVFKIATNLSISVVQWREYPANKMQPHKLAMQTAGSQLV